VSFVASGFSICVAKENLKFAAAHFIAYPGFREALHGHNYQVGVRVEGRLSQTGYVLDFGLVKQLTKEIVQRLDEHTLIPAESDCLKIERLGNSQLRICYGEDEFRLPVRDVCLLPIAHSSAEELARFIWDELCSALRARQALDEVSAIEISVAEAPGQAAIYRAEVSER
jgi:dihydroneopterin triphosphate aldolase (PTPS-III) / 6-pyruvoyltetrahydropterin synthase